jgi:hypothetical protein
MNIMESNIMETEVSLKLREQQDEGRNEIEDRKSIKLYQPGMVALH